MAPALHATPAVHRRVEELRAACESGRVRDVKGFGLATEKRLLAALRSLDDEAGGDLLNARGGILMARRGGERRGEVMNARPLTSSAAAVPPAGARA